MYIQIHTCKQYSIECVCTDEFSILRYIHIHYSRWQRKVFPLTVVLRRHTCSVWPILETTLSRTVSIAVETWEKEGGREGGREGEGGGEKEGGEGEGGIKQLCKL